MYPSTKLYFKHLGAFPDEVQLLSHGRRMLQAVGAAVQHLDNLRAVLSPLAALHAHVLRVDPANFPVRQPGPQGARMTLRIGGSGRPFSHAPSPAAADPVFPGGAGLPPAGRIHGGDAGGVGQVLDGRGHSADRAVPLSPELMPRPPPPRRLFCVPHVNKQASKGATLRKCSLWVFGPPFGAGPRGSSPGSLPESRGTTRSFADQGTLGATLGALQTWDEGGSGLTIRV